MIKHLSIWLLSIAVIVSAQNIWVETTQEDFKDGTFERNIYASHHDGGTIEFVPKSDLNNDGFLDLFTADARGPSVHIYWGDERGYSPTNTTTFNTSGASNCDAADLDCDGYNDFLVAHQITPKISIYWGTAAGPDPSNHFDIPTLHQARQAVFVADLNKDGYLDIITSQQFVENHGSIFWGSSAGYSTENRTDLPSEFGVHNLEIADFNRDNWLDILFVEYLNPSNKIYWGSSSGFSSSNRTLLPAPGSHGASVADLDGNGYLDLIFTAWVNTQSYIYWGDVSGYSTKNRHILNPGYCYGGSAVSDINRDDNLDIVYHHGGGGASLQRIYWGNPAGYSDSDTSWVGIPLETTGGLIIDLNNDTYFDIFCNTIQPNSQSYIFWGPSFTENTMLPVNGDHHGMFREIGNVYNRKYYEDYISSVFDAGKKVDWGIIEWDDSLPTGTDILFYVRSGNAPDPDYTWSEWNSLDNGKKIPNHLNSQYLQYRARLAYINPAYLPNLYEVRIGFGDVTKTIIKPDQKRINQLTIRVIDGTTRQSLGANIHLTGVKQGDFQVDKSGIISFPDVDSGWLIIHAFAAGYPENLDSVYITSVGNTEKCIYLYRLKRGAFKGTVLDSKTNNPINATIEYTGMAIGHIDNDSVKGDFILRNLPPGMYSVTVVSKDLKYAPQSCSVKVNPGEVAERKFLLTKKPYDIILPQINFDVGTASLRSKAYALLNKVGKILLDNPEMAIEIAGHTDSRKTSTSRFPSNWELSLARAEVIREYLIKEFDIDPKRLIARGYADTQPIAPNTTEKGMAMNRRTEFHIIED